jgi:hypothetical protein
MVNAPEETLTQERLCVLERKRISWMVPSGTEHPHANPQQKQPTGKKRKQGGRTQTLSPVSPNILAATISSFV